MSTVQSGRRRVVGMAKENEYGVLPNITDVNWLPVKTFEAKQDFEVVDDESTVGQVFRKIDSNKTNFHTKITISGDLYDHVAGAFFSAALETAINEAEVPAAGNFTHNYSLGNTNLGKSFSFFHKTVTEKSVIRGCVLDTLKVNVINGQAVQYEATFVGMAKTLINFDDGLPVVGNKFYPQHTKILMADNEAEIETADEVFAENFEINFEKNAAPYFAGGELVEVHNNLPFDVNANMTLLLKDHVIEADTYENKKKFVRLEMENKEVFIGETQTNPKIKIDIVRAGLTSWDESLDADSIMRQTLGIEAEGLVDGGIINVQIVDGVADH